MTPQRWGYPTSSAQPDFGRPGSSLSGLACVALSNHRKESRRAAVDLCKLLSPNAGDIIRLWVSYISLSQGAPIRAPSAVNMQILLISSRATQLYRVRNHRIQQSESSSGMKAKEIQGNPGLRAVTMCLSGVSQILARCIFNRYARLAGHVDSPCR